METWLSYIKRLQAIAQTGLTYSENKYDLDRYEDLKQISYAMMADLTNKPVQQIADIFCQERGYATPKVDIRGIIFKDNQLLMVKETIDNRWSLPGGWADIGLTPAEVAVKEVWEEAGLDVKAVKLLAVLDKKRHAHPPDIHYIYKIFILCEIIGGELKPGMETSDVGYFAPPNLPELSVDRITKEQIDLLFEFHNNPDKEPVFD